MEELLKYKIFILGLWVVLFLIFERLFPAAKSPFHGKSALQRYGRNLGLIGFTSILSPTIIAAITLWSVENGLNWRQSDIFPNWLSAAWSEISWFILVDFLILDLFIYWWHRINHMIPFLWRFHEVHHLDEFLDVSSAMRFHFGEVLLSSLVRGAVILLCDIPLHSVIIFETMVLLSSVFQHSNIKLPQRLSYYLAYVIVTPNWHWVHHHAIRRDTDSHYGNSLTIWDRLFGSANSNPRRFDMKIGVQGRKEKTLLGLILRPLNKP